MRASGRSTRQSSPTVPSLRVWQSCEILTYRLFSRSGRPLSRGNRGHVRNALSRHLRGRLPLVGYRRRAPRQLPPEGGRVLDSSPRTSSSSSSPTAALPRRRPIWPAEHRPPRHRQGRLPEPRSPLPPGAGTVREPARAPRRREHRQSHQRRDGHRGRQPAARRVLGEPRQSHQRCDGGDRGREPAPRRRPPAHVPGVLQRHPRPAAPIRELHAREHPGRRLRQGLRVLPRQVRDRRRPEGRRVLHADLDRPPDRRDHRAVQRQDPRSGVRVRRGCFVQSARFVDEHRNGGKGRLSIYGQERVEETLKLCR